MVLIYPLVAGSDPSIWIPHKSPIPTPWSWISGSVLSVIILFWISIVLLIMFVLCPIILTIESELPTFITLEFKVNISPCPIKLFTMRLFWIQAVPLTCKLDKKLVKSLTTNLLVVLLSQIRSLEIFISDWTVILPFIIAFWLTYISLIQLKLPLMVALLFINKLEPTVKLLSQIKLPCTLRSDNNILWLL